VDEAGLVTVTGEATAPEFTLAASTEVLGVSLSASTRVELQEFISPVAPVPVPEIDVPVDETLVISGAENIIIPADGQKSVQYTVSNLDGSPLFNPVWTILDAMPGISVDEQGLLTVTAEAMPGTIALNAAVESETPEGELTSRSTSKLITLLCPAPYSIAVNGPASLDIPAVAGYAAAVLDQEGAVLQNETVIWSLAAEVDGVSVTENGELVVTGDVVPGAVVVLVAAASSDGNVIGTLAITLGAADVPPPAGGGGGGGDIPDATKPDDEHDPNGGEEGTDPTAGGDNDAGDSRTD